MGTWKLQVPHSQEDPQGQDGTSVGKVAWDVSDVVIKNVVHDVVVLVELEVGEYERASQMTLIMSYNSHDHEENAPNNWE